MESRFTPEILDTCNNLKLYWDGLEELEPETNNYNNVVFCNPEAGYVIKMPRTLQANRLRALEYEAELLEILAAAPTPPPLEIPKLLEYGYTYPYIVVSYVPGIVLANLQDFALSSQETVAIGEKMAEGMWWFSNTVRPKFWSSNLGAYWRRFSRRSQLEHLFTLTPSEIRRDTPNLAALLCEIMENYHDFEPQPGDTFFSHNDWHFRNVTVEQGEEGLELHGMFDVGAAQPSSLPQDTRFLYGINPAAAEACARRYEELSGERKRINRTTLRLWGTAEYALRMHHILDYSGPPDAFFAAKTALQRMYPAADWSELDAAYDKTRQ